jgi:hypothetical protein
LKHFLERLCRFIRKQKFHHFSLAKAKTMKENVPPQVIEDQGLWMLMSKER